MGGEIGREMAADEEVDSFDILYTVVLAIQYRSYCMTHTVWVKPYDSYGIPASNIGTLYSVSNRISIRPRNAKTADII